MSPMEQRDAEADRRRLAMLEHPTRRALHDLVLGSAAPVTRADAVRELGLSPSTAAFHLEALLRAGLLEAEFHRTGPRSGPGAGRPTKFYRPATREVAVSVPARQYELAAALFAAAIEDSQRTGAPVRDALRRRASADGRALGERTGSFEDALRAVGFQPREDAAGGLVMGNCPFHRLAQHHTELVCDLNHAFVDGIAQGVPACKRRVVADPGAGRCCVRALEAEAGE